MKKLRICNKCGWAHFPRTRQEVEAESKSFGEYITQQSPETQAQFGYGPLSQTKREFDVKEHFSHVEHCFRCKNSYTDFREENDQDKIPNGCTLQGILVD